MDTSKRRIAVTFIRNEDKVLLALIEYPEKQIWNGIGGWIEIGESYEDGAVREVGEETYIKIDKNNLRKVVEFTSGNCLTVFLADKWSGEIKIKEPSLKELRWFPINEVPYSDMMPGNDDWLPKVLEGKLLKEVENKLIEVESFAI